MTSKDIVSTQRCVRPTALFKPQPKNIWQHSLQRFQLQLSTTNDKKTALQILQPSSNPLKLILIPLKRRMTLWSSKYELKKIHFWGIWRCGVPFDVARLARTKITSREITFRRFSKYAVSHFCLSNNVIHKQAANSSRSLWANDSHAK